MTQNAAGLGPEALLLVADIGNTQIKIGVFEGTRLRFVSRMATDLKLTDDQMVVWAGQFLALNGVPADQITGGIVSSVVPSLGVVMQRAAARLCPAEPMLLGPGVRSGLNIKIDNPAQLGSDMVAAAVAVLAKYPMPAIIFGLGTATTISVLDAAGAFRGGALIAGVGLSLSALSAGTAQLPYIHIEPPKNAIGTNTIDCMKSGVVLGTAAALDGMAERMEEELGSPATLVATGGYAADIVSACRRTILLDEHLILEGLRLIYEKNR